MLAVVGAAVEQGNCAWCPHCLLITVWLACLLQSMAHFVNELRCYPACLPPVVVLATCGVLVEAHKHEA